MTSLRLAYGAGSLVLLSMLSGQASSQAAPPPPPAVTVAKPRQGDHRAGRLHRPLRGGRPGRHPRPRDGLSRQGPFSGRRASSRRATCCSRIDQRPYQAALRTRREATRRRPRRSRLEFAAERPRARRAAAQDRQHRRPGLRPAPPDLADRPARSSTGRRRRCARRGSTWSSPRSGRRSAGRISRRLRLGGQPRQRQRDGAHQHRLARPDPVLLRRRRALVPRLFAPGAAASQRRQGDGANDGCGSR